MAVRESDRLPNAVAPRPLLRSCAALAVSNGQSETHLGEQSATGTAQTGTMVVSAANSNVFTATAGVAELVK